MSRRTRLALASTLLTTALSLPAMAEFPSKAPYIGVSGGYNLRLRDWDLGKNVSEDSTPPGQAKSSPIFALRVGYQLHKQFGVEVAGAYLPIDSTNVGDLNHTLKLDATALYHVLPGNWTPFVAAGVGAYYVMTGGLGSDLDPHLHVGVGVRGLVLPWMAVRAEVRDVISDGFDNGGSNNLELSAGLDFFMLRAPEKVVAQVLDRDGDGIADADDKCPAESGPRATGGCPDKDADGIADAADKCPDVAGKAEQGGCPDKDGDGIIDGEDKCPEAAGKAEQGGCPDKDGDGVVDGEDKCPDVAGKADLAGCPDKDNDGVPDGEDKCPEQTGLKEHQGCLPKEVEKFTGTIQGITFKTKKAEIIKSSYPTLDAAVKVLKDFPSLRLRIEGHTDNVGAADFNNKLSQERAEAVKAYMVSKGVDAGRLETAGYGDTKPKGDNKTSAGRAANRRIEFTVIK